MTLKYILVYHKSLSVHLTVHFKNISKTIEVIIKYLSANKHSYVTTVQPELWKYWDVF